MAKPNQLDSSSTKVCRSCSNAYDATLRNCPKCLKEAKHRHYLKHRELIKQKRKSRYWGDSEKSRSNAREWGRLHPEYAAWKNMIRRCGSEPESENYKDYGGRGIRVCERWSGVDGYINFLQDMGQRPSPKHSIDRRDNNGNYEPENCRWTDTFHQTRNKRNNRMFTMNGKTQCLKDWSVETGISVTTLIHRLGKLGWSVEESLTTPCKIGQKTHKRSTRGENAPS